MNRLEAEVRSQPDGWRQAAGLAGGPGLPPAGARIALAGCGTSFYVAQAVAAWREAAGQLAVQAERRLRAALPAGLTGCHQFVFPGQGPAARLASEAAQSWSEVYPAMEFRHGPISVIGPRTLVWSLGELPAGMAGEIAATGATLEVGTAGPMAELTRIHRGALAVAAARNLDPAAPRRLTRSVVLA